MISRPAIKIGQWQLDDVGTTTIMLSQKICFIKSIKWFKQMAKCHKNYGNL